MKDLHHNIAVEVAVAPQGLASDTTTAGAVIDRQGFESIEFALLAGQLLDGAYTLALAHSDEVDGGGALVGESVVGASDLIGELPTVQNNGDDIDDSNTAKKVGYAGAKRYVRADVVSTGTDDGGYFAVAAMKSNARNNPVA